jgi:hypothetical protein
MIATWMTINRLLSEDMDVVPGRWAGGATERVTR